MFLGLQHMAFLAFRSSSFLHCSRQNCWLVYSITATAHWDACWVVQPSELVSNVFLKQIVENRIGGVAGNGNGNRNGKSVARFVRLPFFLPLNPLYVEYWYWTFRTLQTLQMFLAKDRRKRLKLTTGWQYLKIIFSFLTNIVTIISQI